MSMSTTLLTLLVGSTGGGLYLTIKPFLVIAAIIIALGIFSKLMYDRINYLTLLKFEPRWDRIPERIWLVVKFVGAQYRLFKETGPGLMHFFIFWGFMTLGICTVSHYANGISPGAHMFNLFGLIEPNIIEHAYNWFKDIIEIFVLIAILYALWRRFVTKPDRITRSWEAVMILLFIGTLMVTDWFVGAGEAMHLQAQGTNPWWIPIGGAMIPVVKALGATGGMIFVEANYWVHIIVVLVFLNFLPVGKHFHVITAIPNVFFGNLNPRNNIPYFDCEDENLEKWGNNAITDFSWKTVFDAYTCTECGRCRDNCPAYLTGKPLDPKLVNSLIKHHIYENGPKLVAARAAAKKAGEAFVPDSVEGLVPLITEEMVEDGICTEIFWSCTTCGHCVESCPVLIEHIPRLVDLRRYMVMTEANFPQELNNAFKGMETNSNPWGVGQDYRADWVTEDLGVKTVADNPDFEYLLYLGCSYSYDDRNKKISTALIKLLNAAGVNYAYLGAEEGCCGETARRLGNEYLGNMLVMMNIAVLNAYNVKKIISPCPHCFNTLKNEYSQFTGLELEGTKLEGDFEVMHSTEFIKKLIDEGKLKLDGQIAKNIVFHDSCYLGRYNNIMEQPRDVLKSIPGVKVTDVTRSYEIGFCCGAGGGRMWLEEEVDQRVNNKRFEQILEGKPEVVCTACPYCMTMLDDACKAKGMEEQIKTLDFVEVVAQAAGVLDKKVI